MSNFKDYIELANEMINESKNNSKTSEEKKIKKYTKSGHETLDKQAEKENQIKLEISKSKHFPVKKENEFFIDSNKHIDRNNKDIKDKIKKILEIDNSIDIKIEDHKTEKHRITAPDYVYKITFK